MDGIIWKGQGRDKEQYVRIPCMDRREHEVVNAQLARDLLSAFPGGKLPGGMKLQELAELFKQDEVTRGMRAWAPRALGRARRMGVQTTDEMGKILEEDVRVPFGVGEATMEFLETLAREGKP